MPSAAMALTRKLLHNAPTYRLSIRRLVINTNLKFAKLWLHQGYVDRKQHFCLSRVSALDGR